MAGDPRRRDPADRWATSACRTASRSTARRSSSRTCACTAAPRRCAATCPTLIDLILKGAIDPGKVFDLTLPLDQVAEGYRAMDERRAIKTLLRP